MKRKHLDSTDNLNSKKKLEEFKFHELEKNIHLSTSELLHKQIQTKLKSSEHLFLPPEILNLIFEFSNQDDLNNSSMVCADWLVVILSKRIETYKSIYSKKNETLQFKIEEKRKVQFIVALEKEIAYNERQIEKWTNWKTKFSFEELQAELVKKKLKTKGTKTALQNRLEESLKPDFLQTFQKRIAACDQKLKKLENLKPKPKEVNKYINFLPPSSIYNQRKETFKLHVVSKCTFTTQQKEEFSTISFHSNLYDAYIQSSDFDVILLSPGVYIIDFEIQKSLEFIGNCAMPLDVNILASWYSIQLAQVKFVNLALCTYGNTAISKNFMKMNFCSVEFNHCDIGMENSFNFSSTSNSQLIIQHSIVHDSLRGLIQMKEGNHLILDNCSFKNMRSENDESSRDIAIIEISALDEKVSENRAQIRSCRFNDIEEPIISVLTFGGSNEKHNVYSIEKDEKYEKIFNDTKEKICSFGLNVFHKKLVQSTKLLNPSTSSQSMNMNGSICDCGLKYKQINPDNELVQLWICQNFKCVNGQLKKQISIAMPNNNQLEKSCSHWFCKSQAFEISIDFLKRIEPTIELQSFNSDQHLYDIRLCENGHIKMFLNDEDDEDE